MFKHEYDQLIREHFDLTDSYTRKYITSLKEDAQQDQLLNALSSALYEKMLYWAATDKSRLLEIKGVINHRTSANDELSDILNLCETFYRIAGGDK